MKVQDIIRVQVVAIGFAAALIFASATPAQEISNSERADGKGVVTPGQTAAAQAASQPNGVAEAQATNSAAMENAPAASQDAAVAQQTPIAGSWMTFVLVISFAALTLYALAGTWRADRNRYARVVNARSASL